MRTLFQNQKFFRFVAGLLRLLPPEPAHDLCLWLLRTAVGKKVLSNLDFKLPLKGMAVRVPGIGDLKHPIGLAGGFDKNCLCPDSLAKLGFSFLEIGTVTPLPQYGNPKPRIFRYPDQHSIINRMGFGNDGAATIARRLEKLNWDNESIPLGVNVGKNKVTSPELAAEDFVKVYEVFQNSAKFFVFNISSPNTEGLRDLANEVFLDYLSERLSRNTQKIWIKLDPDMDRKKFQKVVESVCKNNFQGLVLTNTHKVTDPQMGGQSGPPLAVIATTRLEWAYDVHKGSLPMIASGGIFSGIDVFERLSRGASAVEIYTSLIFRGPLVVVSLLKELQAELALRGFQFAEDAIGCHYE